MNANIHRPRPPCLANEGVNGALDPAERAATIGAAALKLEELFDALHIDDHNTRDTPRRVAKMFVEEVMAGRYCEPPELTGFENASASAHLIVTAPIDVRSTCAHHLMPLHGHAFVGVLPAPGGKIIGLSKYDRVVHHFASRLQIQEELVNQIGNFLIEKTSARGLAVRISAAHMCRTQRGVRAGDSGRMITTAYWGAFDEEPGARAEFLKGCITSERGGAIDRGAVAAPRASGAGTAVAGAPGGGRPGVAHARPGRLTFQQDFRVRRKFILPLPAMAGVTPPLPFVVRVCALLPLDVRQQRVGRV